MNVLIIDDQPDVVAGIHSGINWDALSIRQVFCANDIIHAPVLNFMNGLRSIFRKSNVFFLPHMKIFPMHKKHCSSADSII